jgi:hypothetical protein
VRRGSAALGLGVLTIAFPRAGSAQTSVTSAPAFSGSAAAGGVRVTLIAHGFPATDTPVDGGGPTAQVAVDSIGSSTGYAAFPDPGQFAVSVPGLVVGLLAGGAAGLPPVKLPSPPGYPFYVSSDANNNPDVTLGASPLVLTASSSPDSSSASATAGVQTGAGNAALATSTASLVPTSDGSVVAKAQSDVQGLTIGPLTIGEIKSVASETVDASGTMTPASTLELAGVRIGGVPIELTPQGLVALGPTEPVPINPALAPLLKAAGISMQFVAPQQTATKVIAPALQITFPFATASIRNVGQFNGSLTVILGSATAEMHAGQQGEPVSSGSTASTATGSGSVSPLSVDGAVGLPPTSGGGGTSPVALAATPDSPPLSPPGSPPGGQLGAGSQPGTRALPAAAVSGLDVRSLYLLVLLGAVVVSAGGALIRRMGVRA